MPNDSLLTMARPYAWLALVAFVLGFVGTVVLAWPQGHVGEIAGPSLAKAPVSGDWDVPKRI